MFAERCSAAPALSIAVASDLPTGSGLSSSAAFGVALASAFATAEGEALRAERIALDAQAAEHRYVGTRCGIMDQLASVGGCAGGALLIDCRSLAIEPIDWPADWAVVLVDSGIRRDLAASAFNDRRLACERAARKLGLEMLGEADAARVEAADLDAEERRAARHVVSEIARVGRAVDALRCGDLPAIGNLLIRSHASLRDDLRVSLPAIDRLADLQNAFLDGEGGARMMGGGFGGCTIAVTRRARADALRDAVRARYRTPAGDAPWVHVTEPADGLRIEPLGNKRREDGMGSIERRRADRA